MQKIRILSERFQKVKAQHIYREYNKKADQLSKDALVLKENDIYIAGNIEGNVEVFERLQYN